MTHRRIRTTLATGAAALALVAGLAACGGDDDDPAAASGDEAAEETTTDSAEAVTIKTFIYSPNPVTVQAGTTVRWEQLDGTTHSVTAGTREAPQPEVFDADLAKGETFEHTFDEPGTYDYFCTFHNGPGMTGQVVVE